MLPRVLICAVTLSCGLLAQAQNQQAAPPSLPPGTLSLYVLSGRDAINNVLTPSMVVPVIEVRDSNDQPVAGAQVTFSLPSTGAGGFFPGNTITFTTRSDSQGQASAPFLPNGITGPFEIRVNAVSGNRIGEIMISQTNSEGIPTEAIERRSWWRRNKKWVIVGAIAAASAVTLGIVLGGGSDRPSISITPGPPVIGGGP